MAELKGEKRGQGKQLSRPKSADAGLFASKAVAAIYGSYMDERSAALKNALTRKSSADANQQLAASTEKDYRLAIRDSVRFFAELADEILPKASSEARSTIIGAMITAYGARAVEINDHLARNKSLADESRVHVESLPEFSKL